MPLYGLEDDLPAEVADQGDDPIPTDQAYEPDAEEPEVDETDPALAFQQRQQAAALHVPPEEPDDELGGDDG